MLLKLPKSSSIRSSFVESRYVPARTLGMYGVPVMPAAMTGPFFMPTSQAPVMSKYAGGHHNLHHQPGGTTTSSRVNALLL